MRWLALAPTYIECRTRQSARVIERGATLLANGSTVEELLAKLSA
jgi:hypothetical protein